MHAHFQQSSLGIVRQEIELDMARNTCYASKTKDFGGVESVHCLMFWIWGLALLTMCDICDICDVFFQSCVGL